MPDLALISLGTTPGLVRSDESFASVVRAAGASCEIVPVRIGDLAGRLRRQIAVTDFVEAVAARRSARSAPRADAIVYSTITAALLQPRPSVPYAIRFDATAAVNRPGWGGAWQRAVERRPLRGARVLVPVSRGAEEGLPADVGAPVVRVPIPVEPVAGAAERDIDAVAYAGYPRKRGLELLCEAWARSGSGRLVVGGVDRDKAMRWLARCGVPEPAGVEWAGSLPRDEWLALVGRARVYVNASRWEDFGLGPLEALSAGACVVTVPTPGSFEALPLARELAPSLVASSVAAESLAQALQAGLGLGREAREEYAARAGVLLEPYRFDRVVQLVRSSVLPALGVL